MSLLDDFVRASRTLPCPVCARRKWCLIDRARPDNPARVICTKVESERRWAEAGWLHVLRDGQQPARTRVRTIRIAPGEKSHDFGALAAEFTSALAPGAAARLGSHLGLTAESLVRLTLGWATADRLRALGTTCIAAGAWTFPMVNGHGVVIGLRLRTPDGFKYSVKGGQQGLHLPTGLPETEVLLLTEGPTDCAALLDLGFAAIGRPSCSGAEKHLLPILQRLKPTRLVIVADGDEPGLQGARRTALTLLAHHRDVRVIRPPAGVKDARAWLHSTPNFVTVISQINTAIDRAAPLRLSISTRKAGR